MKISKIYYLVLAPFLFFSAALATHAQGKDFQYLIESVIIGRVLKPIIVLIGAIAVVYFLLGVLKYIRAGSEGNVAEAIHMITWGIVALFVMGAFYGLIEVVDRTLQLDNNTVGPPSVGNSSGGTISDQFRNDGTIFPNNGSGFNPDQPVDLSL